MFSVLEDFVACPSETLFESCTKEQLLQIAERFSIDLTTQDKRLKETLVTTLKRSLVDRARVLEVSAEFIAPSESFVSTPCEIDRESEIIPRYVISRETVVFGCSETPLSVRIALRKRER